MASQDEGFVFSIWALAPTASRAGFPHCGVVRLTIGLCFTCAARGAVHQAISRCRADNRRPPAREENDHALQRPQTAPAIRSCWPRLDGGVSVLGPPGDDPGGLGDPARSEEHTSELQSLRHLVCRLLL